MSDERERDGGSMGDAPATPSPADAGEESLRERCATDREGMSPRETSDCAGQDLIDLYENEEDGGS